MLVDYLSPLASQFSIMDTGSETYMDDKRKVGTWKANIIYEQIPWRPDFSSMRNETLSRLDTDWTLHVDCDELPNIEAMRSIERVLTDCSERTLGWLMLCLNYWGGELGITVEEHWHCRLFRTRAAKWYKPVHEQVMLNGNEESNTRGTEVLPKMSESAYIIHAKPQHRLDTSAAIYSKIEGR